VGINRRTPPHKNAVVDGRESEMTITGNAREYAYEMERLAKQIAAERDALKAENASLQDDFAHTEEARDRQHTRADALQAENARLRKLVKTAFIEGFNAGHEEGRELGEFTANGGDARRHEGRGPLWHWQSSSALAALGETQ